MREPDGALRGTWVYAHVPTRCVSRADTSRGCFGPFQKKPFRFPLGRNRVIKAWDVGIGKMRVGETALLTATSDVCYGRDGAGPIPPNADLIFEVELLDIDGFQPSVFAKK